MELQAHLPQAFAPRERTLPAMLERQSGLFGARPLFTCGGETWSFTDTRDIAAGMAGAFAAAGLRRGDRLAILCSNRPEFMRAFLGCAWLGLVAVPINAAVKGPQLAYLLENSGAVALVVEDSLAGALAAAGRGALRHVWSTDGGIGERLPAPADHVPAAALGPGDILAIMYTSGTTGPSKGVLCPHAQYFWWGANTARILGVTAKDVLGTTLPLFHVNALNTFAQALLTGARQALEPRFSASRFWESMAEHGATIGYLLGAMVPILLAREPSAAERAHRMRLALGPGVPGGLQAAFRERTGVQLIEGYGSTESNFVISAEDKDIPPGAMGRTCPGFEARVVDEDDHDVAPGAPGELVLRASEPFAFAAGYHGLEAKTVEAWRNLWLHTGDRVTRDADGIFRFVDRLKDAIRRRGENISSWEVEQALLSHPGVEACAVFPVRSELAEDEVMATVVVKPGATVAEADLVRHCEPLLPRFALPRFVELAKDLPRTENGKVRKFELREKGVGPATWDREAQEPRGGARP